MDPHYSAILLGKDPLENEILINTLEGYVSVEQYGGEVEYQNLKSPTEPDLFIIHKALAKGDGVITCENIRHETKFGDSSILMILENDSVYHKIKCYEAGADDYIIQPYHPEELIRKVKRLSSHSTHKRKQANLTKQATNNADDATKAALEAMRATSDLGLIVKFMVNCQTANTFQELADQLCATTCSLGLTSIVQIHQGETFHTFAQHDEPKQIEIQLLQEAKHKGRVVEDNNLIIVNFELLSIMVIDVPVENKLHGRIKDTLVQLVGAGEIRVRSIMVNDILHAQSRKTISVINLIRQLASDNQKHATNIMVQLSEGVEQSAISLSLTEEQEEHFIELAEHAHKELDSLYRGSDILESHFMRVILGIQKAIKIHEGKD